MRILLIEDDDRKAESVERVVRACCSDVFVSITRTKTLGDGARLLGSTRYDLVILDLMLPYLAKGPVSSSAGVELLRQMRAIPGPNRHAMVVGLSAHPEEISENRKLFEQSGVLLLTYSSDSRWEEAIETSIRNVEINYSPQIELDFVAFCALEEEREGFRSCTTKVSQALVGGLNVEFVRLRDREDLFGALVRLSNPGLVSAVFDTSLAMRLFNCKAAFMTGICAGFVKNTNLGQIVIASPAWEYQAGKWSTDGFEIAPSQVQISPETSALIGHEIADEEFLSSFEKNLGRETPRPSLRHKPIIAPSVTGSAVVADSSRLNHILVQHRKLAALDMETFGVYYSLVASRFPPKPFFSLKTVVDFADGDKSDDLHEYGCHVSARASVSILKKLLC